MYAHQTACRLHVKVQDIIVKPAVRNASIQQHLPSYSLCMQDVTPSLPCLFDGRRSTCRSACPSSISELCFACFAGCPCPAAARRAIISLVLEYRQKPSIASTQPTVIFAVNWLLSPGRMMADNISNPTIFTSPSTVTCRKKILFRSAETVCPDSRLAL